MTAFSVRLSCEDMGCVPGDGVTGGNVLMNRSGLCGQVGRPSQCGRQDRRCREFRRWD